MKCKKETRACGSSTHDDYFHRRTQVLFWPWQSGRSSSYSWWWTTATAAEISAGISQPLKTYVKLHKSETTETCLLNFMHKTEEKQHELWTPPRLQSQNEVNFSATRHTELTALLKSRFQSHNMRHVSRTTTTTQRNVGSSFWNIQTVQTGFRQIRTGDTKDCESCWYQLKPSVLFCLTRRPYVFRLRVKWI